MGKTPLKPITYLLGIARPVEAVAGQSVSARDADLRELTQGDRRILQVINPRAGASACISPQDGAEISSLAIREDGRWHELLYRGGDWRAVEGWPGRAPWLWPVAGWCYLNGTDAVCAYRVGGHTFRIPPHGFIRHRRWQVGDKTVEGARSRVVLDYRSQAADHTLYPFDFDMQAELMQDGRLFTATLTCHASPRNTAPMPFTLGNHLTLDLGSWWGSQWWQGTIHGLGSEAYQVNRRRLVGRKLALPERLTLDDPSIVQAVIPADASGRVCLLSPDAARAIYLRFHTTPATSADDTVWVTHSDPQQRFFCCEPWVGWPNGMTSGRGRVDLMPGEQFAMTFTIECQHVS